LTNGSQNGFLTQIPGKGKSENSHVFTGDLNGGPGGLEAPTSPLSGKRLALVLEYMTNPLALTFHIHAIQRGQTTP
jgi:hypothetical protein